MNGESGLACPECRQHAVRVLDTRPVLNGVAISRRRCCEYCAHRWSTYEIPRHMVAAMIKTGRAVNRMPLDDIRTCSESLGWLESIHDMDANPHLDTQDGGQ